MLEEEINSLISSFENEDTHAVLLNPNKMSGEEFLSLFPDVKKHPYVKHAFIYDKNMYQLGKSIYHELGCFYLQDPSAMIVSSLINIKDNDLVLDMCAAPGGKTIGVSLKLNDTGLIISNDLNKQRSHLIVNNLERLGLGNVIVTNNDFEKIYERYLNKFDVVILDAPCSGSGMFRKDIKMREDWSINKVYKFAEIQKTLISIAFKMLKPGGLLSYSTCSYSKEEDEDVIDYLLDNFDDAQYEEIKKIDKAYINKNNPKGIRLLPSMFNGEGQYICHIRKLGENKPNIYLHDNRYQKDLPIKLKNKDIAKYNNTYFALANNTKLYELNIIRPGIKLGEIEKGIFYYDLHFSHYLSKGQMPTIELNLEESKSYLEGNVINHPSEYKGFVLLTYQNKSVDIAKTDSKVIKNYYPKGLRKKVY